ncbi:MAG: Hsp70 family protein, partial [Kofleriaceae bacterium]
MSDPIVGIDLGTSNSAVAHADGAGVVKVLADDGGYKIHPSVVSFHPSGGVVVGAAAKQRKVIDPQNTIYSVKRLIGRSFRSPEVQTARTRVPFQIQEGANQMPLIATRAGEFAIPEISAIVLDHVRNLAATRLGTAVQRAVVTVPASFNDAQRSATATAGAIAGITVVRVLNEPTAAALAYGHARQLHDIIAVFDFGGGTFDISILKLEDQVYEVLGTAGDTFLGGDDLDERLVDKMVAKFLAEHRIDLRTNEVSMMRLRAVAEQTKIELSRRSRAVVRIDEIAYGPRGAPLNLQIVITRDEFVSLVSDIVDRTFPVCREALEIAGVGVDQVSDVILVGGTTKMPYVRDQVGRFFRKPPRTDVSPEDAVASGAALQGAALQRILARPRSSSRVSAVAPAPPDEATAIAEHELAPEPMGAELSGATMAPSELTLAPSGARPRHPTAGYAEVPRGEPRPDTSYSITRARRESALPPTGPAPTAPPAQTPPAQTLPAQPPPAQSPPAQSPPAQIPPAQIPPAQSPPARALGRMTTRGLTPPPIPVVPAPGQLPPVPPGATPPVPPGARTMFGVPEAPRSEPAARPPAPPARSSSRQIPTSGSTAPGMGAAARHPPTEL